MNIYNTTYKPTKQDIEEQKRRLFKLKKQLNSKRLTYENKQKIEHKIDSIEWWLNIYGL